MSVRKFQRRRERPRRLLYPAQARIGSVRVFGGARTGGEPRLIQAAAALGNDIGAAGIRLVYVATRIPQPGRKLGGCRPRA